MKLRPFLAGLLLGAAAAIPARTQSVAANTTAIPSAGVTVSAPAPGLAEESASYPPFTRQTVTGRPFSSLTQNQQPLLIVFWATWCAGCNEEAPALRRLKTGYGKRLVMVGIAAKERENQPVVRAKARALRLNYPVLFDGDDSLRATFNVKMIPQLLLLSGDGHFLLRTMDLDTMRRKLAELLPALPHANPRASARSLPQSVRAKIRAPSPRN